MIELAATSGHPLGLQDFNRAMIQAAWKGHRHVVARMIQLGARDFNGAMANAADPKGCCGHLEIMNDMVKRGARAFNRSLLTAAESGHLDVVKRLLRLGATNIDVAIQGATNWQQANIVNYLTGEQQRTHDMMTRLLLSQ